MRYRPAPAILFVAAILALAACSASATDTATNNDDGAASPSASATSAAPTTEAGAFTADNCGTSVTVATAPQRIVTIKSTMTQLVVALGAADRIVGTAYQDGEVSTEDQLGSGEIALGHETDAATELADVVDLAERMPTSEGVLSLEPDLVLAGWESAFAADAAGERTAFADLGIATFVAPVACTDPAYAPAPLTWQDITGEITQVGALLGLEDEATRVNDYLAEALAGAEAEIAQRPDVVAGDAPTALWWSSATETPFVGAGAGSPQLVMDTVGLTNIAADLEGGWGPYSWEAAAAADPDYLVLVDASWNTAEHKKEFLAGNPVTAAMSAVVNERYLIVPFATTEAGIGTVEAVWQLQEQLAAASS